MTHLRLRHAALTVVAAAALASCLPEGDKFACATDADCVTGYVCFQSFCQKADVVDYCAGVTCGDHGSCEVKDHAGTCACAEGYTGDKCDACATGYQDKDGDKVCTKDCATAALDCGPGNCVDTTGTATCECPVGNEGADCKTCKNGFQDADGDGTCTGTCLTTGLSCGAHGTCSDASGTAACNCEAEYAGNLCDACAEGFQDDDANGSCNPNCAHTGLSCGEHGTCATTSGFAACACEVGYAGTNCETCAAGFRNDFGVCKGFTKFITDAQGQSGVYDGVFHGDGSSIIFTGYSGSSNFFSPALATVGGGWSDAVVVKLDAGGNKVWATRLGGDNREGTTGIAEDPAGNIYLSFWNYSAGDWDVGGQTVRDVVGGMSLWSLDANGGYRWERSFGGGELHDVAVDPNDGNVYAVGIMNGTPDFGGGALQNRGTWDGVIYSTDSNGNYRWARSLGSNQDDGFEGVAVGPDGNIYVTGSCYGNADLGQSGGSYANTSNSHAAFLASYTAAGQHRWSKFFPQQPGGTAANPYSGGRSIGVSKTGDVYVFFMARGRYDFGAGAVDYTGDQVSGVFARYDSAGVFKAKKEIIAGQPVNVHNITFDKDGNPVFAGNINNGGAVLGDDPTATGGGPFWAHYKPDFTSIHYGWARSGAYPWVEFAGVRDDGAVTLLGHTNNGNIDWGSGNALTPGGSQVWFGLLPPVAPPQ